AEESPVDPAPHDLHRVGVLLEESDDRRKEEHDEGREGGRAQLPAAQGAQGGELDDRADAGEEGRDGGCAHDDPAPGESCCWYALFSDWVCRPRTLPEPASAPVPAPRFARSTR